LKFLIVSTKHRLSGYARFVSELNSMGEESILVDAFKSVFLSDLRPLDVIPFPRLLSSIKDFNPDLVLTDYVNYIPQMTKLLHKPVLYHLGGAEQGKFQYLDIAMYPNIFARAYTLYLVKINGFGMKNIDHVLPNCKWLESQVNKNFPNCPSTVLYEGIDPKDVISERKSLITLRHPAVLSIFPMGIFGKVIGLLKFMETVKRMPGINFYVVGDGPYFQLVKKKCPPNMILLGQVPKTETTILLRDCDLFVHPSGLDASPRSVKEAAILEKPIVASNVGGIPEIVENNKTGYLCDINDIELWIEKILYLLENKSIAINFGKEARRHVEYTYSWNRIAENFVNDMKKLEW
jgi:glycosyltransferase involved in cell wall biosynthesis